MGTRRCVSKEIYTDDNFISLNPKSKLLYLYLMLNADDDGIVANSILAMSMAGATKKNLDELIETKYIIEFTNEQKVVYIIKHWLLQNMIPPSKRKASNYTWVLDNLYVEENLSYTLNSTKGIAFSIENIRKYLLKKDV